MANSKKVARMGMALRSIWKILQINAFGEGLLKMERKLVIFSSHHKKWSTMEHFLTATSMEKAC